MSSREVGAPRWLVTGQAVVKVEHPPPPLLPVAATAPRRLKCLLRSEREPATPPCPPAIAPAGWYSSPSFSFMSSSPSCLQLGGGNPRTPCRLLIHQGACRPLDPLLMGKFGPRVSLYLSLSAPPSSQPNCVCATFFSVMSSAWRGKPPHLLSAFLFTKGCAAPWTPCCWR